MSDSELAGRTAVVTGAAKGIGAAAARALASLGARVVLVDIDETVRDTAAGMGDGAHAVVADVSQAEAAQRAVDAALAATGRLDILVNNAGIQRYGTVADTTEEMWDEVLATNLKSLYLMARAAAPHLLESGAGSIVNVASVQGLVVQRNVAAYAASKGGAIALTKSMAVDLAPRVRANAVCPGSIDTPMLREAADLFAAADPDAGMAEWGRMHPMQRVGTAEEVAQTIAFLAGPRSGFTTGAVHLVDGGLLAILR